MAALKSFLVEDEIWEEARKMSFETGDSISKIIRIAMTRYIQDYKNMRDGAAKTTPVIAEEKVKYNATKDKP